MAAFMCMLRFTDKQVDVSATKRGRGSCLFQVMLKDLADSKRLNGGIHALPAQATSPLRRDRRAAAPGSLSATILSGLFWPAVQARPCRCALLAHLVVSPVFIFIAPPWGQQVQHIPLRAWICLARAAQGPSYRRTGKHPGMFFVVCFHHQCLHLDPRPPYMHSQ